MTRPDLFDEAYYARHYLDPKTRAKSPDDYQKLAQFVFAYANMLDIPLETVLDLGCGLGFWRDALLGLTGIDYEGVEISDYLCSSFGWEHGSVVDYPRDNPADFVICQDVIQYLNDREAESAIANLGRLTKGLMYLEVLTVEDWERHCDQSRTDGNVHLRSADWYRERLSDFFIGAGGGVWVCNTSGAVLFTLERTA